MGLGVQTRLQSISAGVSLNNMGKEGRKNTDIWFPVGHVLANQLQASYLLKLLGKREVDNIPVSIQVIEAIALSTILSPHNMGG